MLLVTVSIRPVPITLVDVSHVWKLSDTWSQGRVGPEAFKPTVLPNLDRDEARSTQARGGDLVGTYGAQ